MLWRTLRLVCACALLAASGVPACGGNASDSNSGSVDRAGNGGSGGSNAHPGSGTGGGSIARAGTGGLPAEMSTVPCGSKSCTGLVVPVVNLPVPACCADDATNHCGLDSSALASIGGPTFPEVCQPLAQPGTADASCPESAPAPVPQAGFSISFPGCCRPDHRCGYQLDSIQGVFRLGLGCVDAEPFLAGEAAQPCGEAGASGAGGDSAGVAGAGGDSSGASVGAGAGGDSGSTGG